MSGSVQYLNPDGLHKNPAYSQAVAVTGHVTTVYVGGQNAVDASGAIVGKGASRYKPTRCSSRPLVAHQRRLAPTAVCHEHLEACRVASHLELPGM
jgi:ABC-type hemin transport system substrate-binding protein